MAVLDFTKKIGYTKYKVNFWGAACTSVALLCAELLSRCNKRVCIVDFTPEQQVYCYYRGELEETAPIVYHEKLTVMLSTDIKNTDFSAFDVVMCCNGYSEKEDDVIIATKGSYNYLIMCYDMEATYACIPILEKFCSQYSIIVNQDVGDVYRRTSLISIVEKNERTRKLLEKVYFLPYSITDRKCELDAKFYAIMRYSKLSNEYANLLLDMGVKMGLDELSLRRNMK